MHLFALAAAIGVCAVGCSFAADDAGDPLCRELVRFQSAGDEPVALEGELLWLDREDMPATRPAAVVCHPDPRYGGTMHNRVSNTVAQYLAGNGLMVLRFNFRGVGASEGSFGGGIAEADDCLGAVAFLRERPTVDPKLVALVGYSFGSVAALRAKARDRDVRAYVGIAFPLADSQPDLGPYGFVRGAKGAMLFVSGDRDEISGLTNIRRLIKLTGLAGEMQVVEGADHFFGEADTLTSVCRATSAFLRQHLR